MITNFPDSPVKTKKRGSKIVDFLRKRTKDKGEERNPVLPALDQEGKPLASGDVVYTLPDIQRKENKKELIYFSETRGRPLKGNTYGVVGRETRL